jgi:hydroxymethylglutaryl-CoA reductase (NADPH)
MLMNKNTDLPVFIDEETTIPGKNEYSKTAQLKRIEFLKQKTVSSFDKIGSSSYDSESLKGNIENFIGEVAVPVGIAGPLLIKGEKARGVFYAPFATTEGALVASSCRGARAISEAGGVTTKVLSESVHRAPAFVCEDMHTAVKLEKFINSQFSTLSNLVKDVSKNSNLIKINSIINGRTLHSMFMFTTGEAAGQNMVTIASHYLAQWITNEAKKELNISIVECYVEGGSNGDKKVNFFSFINGRGVKAAAECFIPNSVFEKNFKLDSQTFFNHYLRGVSASALIGSVGVNVNIANVLAAIFLATGQDVGSVHESSIGYLHIEKDKEGLYCVLTMPSILVGTLGGGTRLPHQQECLQILGCQGEDSKHKLAEIIVGFALGLDLSTWAAIAGHHFTEAHTTLGRNK